MKHQSPRLGTALPGAVLFAALLAPGIAHAQGAGPAGVTNGLPTGPVVGTANTSVHKEAPPPALPGARTPDTEPAPMDRPAGDMRPNEALFDAVNRGDILAARDAIGRGADLNATNELGLTPVELSVDLGRNDITFLLLSMRGASGGAAPPVAETGKPAAPVRTAARPVARTTSVVARPVAPPAPRQYADSPGTPVPQAGFLGFGGSGH